ncbi:MAG TPA: 3-phosphoshikimate 1-carboxyvinyltransferase [Acidimicrobiales bacterium]|nr:3-phosphoshikimate 1-carboxyvinyltransferase [Acidimicrobiales bacterium]
MNTAHTAGAAGPGAALAVDGGRPLRGTLRVPGDKSLSHRALIVGALARGVSRVGGLSDGDDVARTAAALRALGATIETDTGDGAVVRGGPDHLHSPGRPLDLGNSGTSMRLLAGVVAGWPWKVVLGGDASLSARPMDRIAEPLEQMGATVTGEGAHRLPPLTVSGGALRGIDYTPPVASAQVKSCVLLAGLRASGETVVREPVPTRVHTEELLERAGAQLRTGDGPEGHVVRVRASELAPIALDIPGDPSQAAFWLVAACVVPGSEVTVTRVYTGPARRGAIDVLARMGAQLEEVPRQGPDDLAATADVTARASRLVGTEVRAEEITGLDEVPALAVAAACAEGTTVFFDVGELRVKESDRLAAVAALVRAFGAGAEVSGDDLVVEGAARLAPAVFDAGMDHRIAMAAAVAGLAAPRRDAPSVVTGWESVATSYPGFARDLAALTEKPAR